MSRSRHGVPIAEPRLLVPRALRLSGAASLARVSSLALVAGWLLGRTGLDAPASDEGVGRAGTDHADASRVIALVAERLDADVLYALAAGVRCRAAVVQKMLTMAGSKWVPAWCLSCSRASSWVIAGR